MKGYFLDTSVVVDYLHGRKDVVDYVSSLDLEINSSYVVLCELYEGVARVVLEDKERVRAALKEHFSNYANIFSLNEFVAEKFGEIRANLKASGQTIEDMDILIAATCLVFDQTLVTKNQKHFDRIAGLNVKSVSAEN